jgi:hypothetical protein
MKRKTDLAPNTSAPLRTTLAAAANNKNNNYNNNVT